MAAVTSLPIKQRPPAPLGRSILFSACDRLAHLTPPDILFLTQMVGLHSLQIIALPLLYVQPALFERIIDWTKHAFGQVLIFITAVWAPTRFIISSDSSEALEALISRDKKGRVIGLNLPARAVVISNHQIYNDWSYIWNLLFFAGHDRGLVILLKKSLKWVPIVGPAMQMFRFVFMARSWEADKLVMAKELARMGDHAEKQDDPLQLLIFPEGVLISDETKPISAKFAAKMGIPDLRHCVLPRSTGLLFCLRALAQRIDDLPIIDLTIGYEGIASGQGQEFHTLQSVFGAGQPPPAVHVHIRTIPASEIPSVPSRNVIASAPDTPQARDAASPTEEERKTFDEWLRKLWTGKDEALDHFYREGVLVPNAERAELMITFRKPLHWFGAVGSVLLGIAAFRVFGLELAFLFRLIRRLF